LYAEERQQEIVRLARAEGRVDVASLADTLHVTAETIRRDLTMLERAGVLRRVHGGAIPVERIGFEPALAARDSVLIDEKERIAKAALAEVPDEGAIILDAGTTTARLAQALPVDRELTVVVNSPPRDHPLAWLAERYVEEMVSGATETIATLGRHGKAVYIVTSGLLQAVAAFARVLNLRPEQVHAVEVHLDATGTYRGYDSGSPLCCSDGKAIICRRIAAKHGKVAIVGDGVTDLAARASGMAQRLPNRPSAATSDMSIPREPGRAIFETKFIKTLTPDIGLIMGIQEAIAGKP